MQYMMAYVAISLGFYLRNPIRNFFFIHSTIKHKKYFLVFAKHQGYFIVKATSRQKHQDSLNNSPGFKELDTNWNVCFQETMLLWEFQETYNNYIYWVRIFLFLWWEFDTELQIISTHFSHFMTLCNWKYGTRNNIQPITLLFRHLLIILYVWHVFTICWHSLII